MQEEEMESSSKLEEGNGLDVVDPEVYIVAENIDYVLIKEKKKLLDGVNADFGPGEFCACLGPSGAGKTTFLNTCAGRVPRGVARLGSGTVKANCEDIKSTRDFSKFGTVAPQDDVVLPALSVYESLIFAAKLRNAAPVRVEALLKTFELEERRHLAAALLSGGQRKRLSIALELVHSPSVCFCDEPTSGLDSRVAFQVIKTLADLCLETRMCILATIHQPSPETLLCFDRMLVLTAGKVCFSGTVHFASLYFDGDQQIKSDQHLLIPRNCADEAIDQASDADAAVARWHAFLQSDKHDADHDHQKFLQDEAARRTRLSSQAQERSAVVHASSIHLTKKASFTSYTFPILLHRTFLQALRMQGFFQIKSACLTSLMYGLIFFRQQNVQQRVSLKLGALFLALLMNGLVPGIITCLFVPTERPTLRREYFNGIWQLREYLAARTLVSMLIHAVGATIYTIVITYMAALKGSIAHLLWPLILLGFITQQIGICLGSIFPTATVAVPAFIPINIMGAVFAGFFFTKSFLTKNAQKVLYVFWYLSFYRYVFARVITNEFFDGHFEACDVSSGDFCPYAGYAEFPGQLHVPRKVVPRDLLSIHTGFAIRWNFLILLAFLISIYVLTFVLVRTFTLQP